VPVSERARTGANAWERLNEWLTSEWEYFWSRWRRRLSGTWRWLMILFTAIAAVGAYHAVNEHPGWGTVGEWFGGWATAIAVVIAVRTFEHQNVLRRDQEQQRGREQAELVRVRWDEPDLAPEDDFGPTWRMVVRITNRSPYDIHRVEITVSTPYSYGRQRRMGEHPRIDVLPAEREQQFEVRLYVAPDEQPPEVGPIVRWFDHTGTEWGRLFGRSVDWGPMYGPDYLVHLYTPRHWLEHPDDE
jgi:hypothetical protein